MQNNETVPVQNSTVMSIDKCLDDLKYTRNFDLYLDMLNVLKDRYLIILSIKDTQGSKISESVIQKIKKLGFINYVAGPRRMYIGIANKGNIVFDCAADKPEMPVSFSGEIENIKLFVSSKSWLTGNAAEIIIDGVDWSLNERGFNFVVYDCEKLETADVSTCDSFLGKPTFFHRNLYLSDRYFDSHIYMPEKYMTSITQTMKRSYFSNRKLTVQEVERGIFLPNANVGGKAYGGICDENFNFIAGHQVFSPENGYTRHINGSYSVQAKDIDYIDETVLYGGTMINHPGHLITECFASRIWWFVKNTDSDLKIAVATIWDNDLTRSSEYKNFVEQYLNVFGISEERIVFIKKPTQFKKIIIPDQSAVPLTQYYPYEFTTEYAQVFEHIKKQLSPAKYKKIYLTKKQADKKNIIGEDYFIDFYKKRGFEIINPEDYTIKEIAELMYGADEVAALEGTNCNFAIFCKPTVKLTLLARMYYYYEFCQQLINESVGIKEIYLVNISGNFINRTFALGLTLLSVTEEFKKYVKDVFNETVDITPEESFNNCLYEYLTYFPEYYSDTRMFNKIKNLKMLDILKGMSEVFLRKEFDTSNLDLSTNESDLQKQVKNLTAQKKSLADQLNTLTEENKNLRSIIAQNEIRLAQFQSDQNKLNAELLEVHRQKDGIGQKFIELYQQKDTLYKKLLEAYQQKIEADKKLFDNIEKK